MTKQKDHKGGEPLPPTLAEMHAASRAEAEAGDPERMSEGAIHWRASIVADGTATPEEARSLLAEFVRQMDAGSVSPRMLEHLRDCFAAFLAGRKRLLPYTPPRDRDDVVTVRIRTLEKAFGLSRPGAGRPRIDADTLTQAAMEVLAARLDGASHQDALAAVAEDRRAAGLPVSNESEIGQAWAAHSRDAPLWLRIARDQPFTPAEIARLSEIYADTPGVVLPGERPFEGRHAIPGSEPQPAALENSENKPV